MNDYQAENIGELKAETITDWRLVAYTTTGGFAGSILATIIWAGVEIAQALA